MPAPEEDPRVGTLWEGRCLILGRLGAGPAGTVYSARPSRSERLVALKLLSADALRAGGAFERFRAATEALGRLGQRHVLPVHECGRGAGGEAFVLMDLCEGGSLAESLRRRGALALEDAARVLLQVGEALAAAHDVGLTHGGLKAANVLFADGEVKVSDFFLNVLLQEVAGRGAESPYAGPEQRSGVCDPRSDVYSLGVVAYEALTGALPQARRRTAPPPPRWLRPEVPEAASKAILRALDPLPAARTAGVRALVETLAEALTAPLPPALAAQRPQPAAPVRPEAPPPAPRPGLSTGPLPEAARRPGPAPVARIGRAAEMGRLLQGLEAALSGRGQLITIAGEPGLGKTTLVSALIDRVRADHPQVLVALGRCSEHFGPAEAYLPLLEAVSSLVAGPSGELVAETLANQAPTWQAQIGKGGAAAGPDVRPAPDRMSRELMNTLLALAARRPVLLVLEDLHWADVASVDFVSFAAARMASARILVVATYRAEDVAASEHPLGRVLRGLTRSAVWSEIAPTPFSEMEVAAQLGSELGVAVPSELAQFVYRKTEGNPLFVTNVLNHLLQTGALQVRGGTVLLARTLESLESSVPHGVRGVIAEKIDRLAGEEQRLLQAASVLGDSFEAAVVAAVLGEDEAPCEERLERLRQVHGLLARVGEVEFPDGAVSSRYRFTHSLYQNVLYGSVGRSRLAEWHAAAGAALARLHEAHLEPLLVPLTLHFDKGRDAEHAIHYGEQAAELLALHSPREALRLLERVLALVGRLPRASQQATRSRLLVRLGRQLAETAEIVGDPACYDRAEQVVSEALRLDPGSAEARTILGLVHLERGHNRRAFLSFSAVLEAAPAHAPALDGLSYLLKNTGLWSQSLQMQERAAVLDPRYAHSIRRLSCLLYQDRFSEARAEAAALVASRPKLAHYSYWAGIAEYYAGDDDAARTWIERGYALDPEDRIAQGVFAFVLALQGERPRARELLRSAETGAAADGTFTYWIGKVYAHLGEPARAVEWIARAEGLGYWNAAWVARDRAIRVLHGFPPFEERLRSLAQRQQEFARLVDAHGLP